MSYIEKRLFVTILSLKLCENFHTRPMFHDTLNECAVGKFRKDYKQCYNCVVEHMLLTSKLSSFLTINVTSQNFIIFCSQ